MFYKITRLSIRLGVPGTLVYITTQEGLWGSPEETFLFYQKVEEILPSKEAVIPKDQEEQLKAVVEKVILLFSCIMSIHLLRVISR